MARRKRDYYDLLGVDKSADEADLKRAYRELARKYHPDLNPEGAETFKHINEAYAVLSDPRERSRYDRWGHDPDGSGAGGGFSSVVDAAQEVINDVLRRRKPKTRGRDLRYTLDVPFLDTVRGAKTRITLPEGGNLDVQIPKGMQDGQTLRLRGRGGAGYDGGQAGDALVTVRVLAHPVFQRDGDDIMVALPITIDEAILGGKVTAPTIDGPVSVTIPKGASSGRILRLRGRGLSRANSKAGDQLVTLRIVSPPDIDANLSDFMTEWRKTNSHDPRKTMMKETPQ